MFNKNKNKIKIVRKGFLPIQIRTKIISKTKENGMEEEEKRIITYFSLQVPIPNNSVSIIRCFAQREVAESLEQEISPGDVLEIEGYLRNEKKNKQILVIV